MVQERLHGQKENRRESLSTSAAVHLRGGIDAAGAAEC